MAADTKVMKFTFTLNNYTPEEEASAVSLAMAKAKFCVIGHETSENGTPHLQGFMNLKAQTRFSAIKKVMPRAHLEKANGTDQQNLDYCTKQDKNAFIHGEPQRSGKRNDLESFKAAAKAGLTYDEALEEHTVVAAKYPRFTKEYLGLVQRQRVPATEMPVPRDWQARVLAILETEPHPRHIHWIYDPQGGAGKTYLAKHLVSKHGAFYTNGGKSSDVFYAYQGQRIAIFDFVRESEEFINYGCIEAIKNGLVSSNKYESQLKTFAVPHIVVFANFRPNMGKFSADRLQILEI